MTTTSDSNEAGPGNGEDWKKENLKIRSQYRIEAVKGLYLINGGGALAMLAFLPAIWESSQVLSLFVVSGVALFSFGLREAAQINFLNEKISLAYERVKGESPNDDSPEIQILQGKRDNLSKRALKFFFWATTVVIVGIVGGTLFTLCGVFASP